MRCLSCFSFITLLIVLNYCGAEELGMLGKIKEGFKLAGKLFGLDEPGNLAQMVSQTFSEKFTKKSTNSQGNVNIFSGFLRLLGLDTKKLSAIAVNAIIFVAQLISSTLSKPVPSQITESRKLKDTNLLNWMLNNSKVSDMLDNIKDSKLSENVVQYIKERSLDEDTDCVQLLICKTAPLIWGMQKSLNSTTKNAPKGSKMLFQHLPTVEEFAEHSDKCEKQHQYCLIYY